MEIFSALGGALLVWAVWAFVVSYVMPGALPALWGSIKLNMTSAMAWLALPVTRYREDPVADHHGHQLYDVRSDVFSPNELVATYCHTCDAQLPPEVWLAKMDEDLAALDAPKQQGFAETMLTPQVDGIVDRFGSDLTVAMFRRTLEQLKGENERLNELAERMEHEKKQLESQVDPYFGWEMTSSDQEGDFVRTYWRKNGMMFQIVSYDLQDSDRYETCMREGLKQAEQQYQGSMIVDSVDAEALGRYQRRPHRELLSNHLVHGSNGWEWE